MRLIHVTPYYAPAWAYGGVVRAVTGLARAQVAMGHEVHVLTTDALDPAARVPIVSETMDGVRVTRVRNRSLALRGALNVSTPVGLGTVAGHLIRDRGADVVHCHEFRTVENLRVSRVAAGLGVPLLVSPHGTLSYRTGRRLAKRAWDRAFGPRLARCFDGVVALTPAEAAEVNALWARLGVPIAADRIAVVPNGVAPGEFDRLPDGEAARRRWGLGDGPVLLFLGRLDERKGPARLVAAFAEIARSVPAARLLLAGPDGGALARLRADVVTRGLGGRVTFAGLLAHDARLQALAVADVFVLPAVGEGFSMAVLEALAAGVPVVVSPDCHFPEVETAGAGLVVEPTPGPLRGALAALVGDRERRAAMGRRGRELIRRHYTWPRVVARLDRVYEAVVVGRDRR